jgi:hypothetical protein
VALEVSLQIGMNVRMTPIPQEVHKQTTKKIVTYCRHCKELDSGSEQSIGNEASTVASMSALDTKLDSGSEQSTGNEASTLASMSKYSTTLGSTLRLRGTQLGRIGRDARAIASA